jgi:hypothetical protein
LKGGICTFFSDILIIKRSASSEDLAKKPAYLSSETLSNHDTTLIFGDGASNSSSNIIVEGKRCNSRSNPMGVKG